MDTSANYFKKNPTDTIWWKDNSDSEGVFEFTFDKIKIYNLFEDYPHALTAEEKAVFDKENPFWYNFFFDRQVKEYGNNR